LARALVLTLCSSAVLKKRAERGAVACAIANNPSIVVDAVRHVEISSRVRRNEIAQVLHLLAVVRKRVIIGLADYDSRVIDRETSTGRLRERVYILEFPAARDEGVPGIRGGHVLFNLSGNTLKNVLHISAAKISGVPHVSHITALRVTWTGNVLHPVQDDLTSTSLGRYVIGEPATGNSSGIGYSRFTTSLSTTGTGGRDMTRGHLINSFS
jgi:hypothetical protein